MSSSVLKSLSDSETTSDGETVLPSGADKRRAVQVMFDTIAPRYDLLNLILTFGLDTRWRCKAVKKLNLPPHSVVIDLACGTGDFCKELVSQQHTAIGFDLSINMLRNGMKNCARLATRRTQHIKEQRVNKAGTRHDTVTQHDTGMLMVHADILSLPLRDSSVDASTCGFALRNLVAVPPLFNELSRVIRANGRVALLEVDTPKSWILRQCHKIYFGKIVPLIGGLLSDRAAYRYLPRSTAYLPTSAELIQGLLDAGFENVEHERLTGGVAQLITATKTGDTD